LLTYPGLIKAYGSLWRSIFCLQEISKKSMHHGNPMKRKKLINSSHPHYF